MEFSLEIQNQVLEESMELLRKHFSDLRDGTGLAEILLSKETDEERMKILEDELTNGYFFTRDQVAVIFKRIAEVPVMEWYGTGERRDNPPYKIAEGIAEKVYKSMVNEFQLKEVSVEAK